MRGRKLSPIEKIKKIPRAGALGTGKNRVKKVLKKRCALLWGVASESGKSRQGTRAVTTQAFRKKNIF